MTDTLAHKLWRARDRGTVLPKNVDGCPHTEAEAYEIQAAIISISGLEVIGWKIGATAASLFEVLGLSRPFVGPLFRRFTQGNDAELEVLPGHGLETEFALSLGSSLPFRDRPYSREEVAAAIAAVIPSFEIVGLRFEGGTAGAGLRLIADCGANVAAILGPRVDDWSDVNLADYPVTLSVNGKAIREGNPSTLLWDHIFDAVTWVASHPVVSRRGLLAGDLIMTGTLTGITPVAPGDTVEADFGTMGVVRGTFR